LEIGGGAVIIVAIGLMLLGVIITVVAKRAAVPRSGGKPWEGRQGLRSGNPNDRPDNPRFPTWDAAFNRLISDELRFLIEYADSNGEVTKREISPKSIHLLRGKDELYIVAHCHLRGEERTFLSSRILSAFNVKTRRWISDLGSYLRSRY
jgi:hypothetical protein